MPNWNEVLDECRLTGSGHDVVRRKYVKALAEYTNRNVILYYSGWLQKGEFAKQGLRGFDVNDADKTGFMATINKLDRTRGLDLVLHTPGGEMAATESIVDYLRSMFDTDVRAIVPQLAMSAGTMIALSCKEIVMGKHSNLGPIDPQIGGVPAHGIIEEVAQTVQQVTAAPYLAPLYQMIFAKYGPTLIGEAQKSIDWANQFVTEWLKTGMFADDPDAAAKASKILDGLGDHALTLSHARHISMKMAADLGIKIVPLESDKGLQDAVLSLHHACIQTFSSTPAVKIIENQNGIAYVEGRAQAVFLPT